MCVRFSSYLLIVKSRDNEIEVFILPLSRSQSRPKNLLHIETSFSHKLQFKCVCVMYSAYFLFFNQ